MSGARSSWGSMLDIGETLLILSVLLAPVFFIASLVGIRRATKRFGTKDRSASAAVWATIVTTGWFLVGLSGVMSTFFAMIGFVMALTWLVAAVWANRLAVRVQPSISAPSAPSQPV